MRYLSRKVLRLVFLITLFWGIFLTSCSTLSLTYRYADWLLYWKIDHYIDITSDQQSFLQDQLATLRQWHRKKELPRYILFLSDVKAKWHDGLTQHELETIFQHYTSLWKSLGQRLATEGTPILTTMNHAQIQDLEQTMRKENQELLDRIGTDRLERMEKRVEKVFDRLEDWLGPLTPDQKLQIEDLIRKIPDTTQAWFQNRLRRQDTFIVLLKLRTAAPKLEQKVRDLLVTPEKGASQAYISAMQQRESALFPTIIAIDRLVTFQQREHANHKLDELIQELENITRT